MNIFRSLKLPAIEWLCVFFAIAIQIQASFWHDFEGYKGLRLNLADFVLPALGLLIFYRLQTRKDSWPAWQIPGAWHWLAGLFLLLIGSLVNTYIQYGVWSHWALINKIPGFFVLIAYFCLGGWIAAHAGVKPLKLFFRVTAFFFGAVMLAEIATVLITDFLYPDFAKLTGIQVPLRGLMGNRNAYALWVLVMACLLIGFDRAGHAVVPRKALCVIMALLPFFLIQIGSRAGLIAAGLLMLLWLILYRKSFLPLLLCLAAGSAVIFAAYAHNPGKLFFVKYERFYILEQAVQITKMGQERTLPTDLTSNEGDNNRFRIIDISLDMIAERPVLGSGLGSSFIEQEKERGRYDIIDCTPLWLWVETGLPGLLAFSAFFIVCFRRIAQSGRREDFYGALNKGMMLAMVMFAVMALFHEVAYTRQMWFLLGLSLAMPNRRQAGSAPL